MNVVNNYLVAIRESMEGLVFVMVASIYGVGMLNS